MSAVLSIFVHFYNFLHCYHFSILAFIQPSVFLPLKYTKKYCVKLVHATIKYKPYKEQESLPNFKHFVSIIMNCELKTQMPPDEEQKATGT